jgi:rSAM/selenodomain-associated transferase 2
MAAGRESGAAPARRISIVMPVLNEALLIGAALERLAPLRRRGAELIVADGGSGDGSAELARPRADRVIESARGRAAQMNAGAAVAGGDLLLFLHVDSRLPADADRLIRDGLARSGRAWGRFDIAIEGRHPLLPVIAGFMNRRSRLTGICTGDQGLFLRRELFDACGGFPPIALMEDIAFSRELRRRGPPLCLGQRLVTSGRRWERRGALRTVLLMWRLRLAYFLGADPQKLAGIYDAG